MENIGDQGRRDMVDAARSSLPVTIQIADSHDASGLLESSLTAFLDEAGRVESADILYFCLRELVGNAVKANAKRIWFLDHKLSLDRAEDYDKGMRAFGRAYAEEHLELNRRAAIAGLKVSADLRLDGELFTCSVRNGAALTTTEAARIADRLHKARDYDKLEDSLGVIDSTEGAGLGLILLCQVLKKIGLQQESFSIASEGGQTVARLSIPVALPRIAQMEDLSQRLVDYVEALPAMPENLVSLLDALSNDKLQMADIAEKIGADPSLTAYILRVANSAAYHVSRRISAIREAVTLIGLRGLKYALLQYGVTSLLGRPPAGAADLWRRSNQVAFCARYLAELRSASQSMADDALVGGVLHDMGMMVQYAVNPKLIRTIETVCEKREIPLRLMEDIMTGLNHARIGALLARKWDFPELLIQAIEFHHRPWAAAPEHRRTTGLVYLADCLCGAVEGSMGSAQIDASVLRDNGVRTPAELEELRRKLAKASADASASDEKRGIIG